MLNIDKNIDTVSKECSVKLLEHLYRYAKRVSYKYYKDGKISSEYKKVIEMILNAERLLKLNYICDVKMNVNDTKDVFSKIGIEKEPRDVLNYIVNYVKRRFSKDNGNQDFNLIDVTNSCELISDYVSLICQYLYIPCMKIKIDVAYDNQIQMFNGSGYHYFNMISILDKKYLMDCSYKQFFKTDRSSLERLGIPLITAPYPGTFMLLNEERKKVANTILKQGWIEATDENLKHYYDGFTLSFRNGLYYENLGLSYETNYTIEDYMRFIYTSDSQIKHESIEFLGAQKRPLDNPKMVFKK